MVLFLRGIIKAMLYIVSTPIGNLKDVSQRAIETLGLVDVIIAESPTDSMRLLNAYGILGKKIFKYNDRNKKGVSFKILELLKNNNVAYVSSAGTPGISDPGQDLVEMAYQAGIEVCVIPGPSALVSAVAMSGFRSRQFTFVSFPPKKTGQLEKLFKEQADRQETLVFFESPYRVLKTLEILFQAVPSAKVCVAKEMTKIFERYFRGGVGEVIEQIKSDPKNLKGEFVIVVDFS